VKRSSRSLEFELGTVGNGSQPRGIKRGPPALFTPPPHCYYSNYSVGAAPRIFGLNFFLVMSCNGFRWEDNIKMDLREVGGVGDWMELAQDRVRWRALVNTVMNLRVP